MAKNNQYGFFNVGTLHDYRKDPYPTTGNHLDWKVYDIEAGKYNNPAHYKSIFGQHIVFGPNKLPLYVQGKDGWVLNPQAGITQTSGYGPRAMSHSNFHHGIDIAGEALKPGTPVYWAGPILGSKTIDGSNKAIETLDPNTGKKYRVHLSHVNPASQDFTGAPTATGKPETPGQTGSKPPQSTATNTTGTSRQIVNLNFGDTKPDENNNKKNKDWISNITDSLMAGLIRQTMGEKDAYLSSNPYSIDIG
jgi:hypothetical protein